MASLQAASFVSEVLLDAASCVGMELAMFGMAAVAYVLFGGLALQSRSSPPHCGGKQIGGCRVAAGRGERTGDLSPGSRNGSASAGVARPQAGKSGALSPVSPALVRAPAPLEASGSSERDLQRHAAAIRGCAQERNLGGAERVFKQLQASGAPLSPLIGNCFLDACVQCGDLGRAASHFAKMKAEGFVDIVSYNIMIKTHIASGQAGQAHALVKEIPICGLKANNITFHTLLHGRVLAKDRRGMWEIIDEMQEAGVSANSVTCSILLKSLTEHAMPADVRRIITLAEQLEELVDEGLFSSLIEACIRMKQLSLLSDFMQRYKHRVSFAAFAARTYGSMFKAYGQAGDVARVRELWQEMETQGVIPTSITLGCLTEAFVINSLPDEAWSVVRTQLECEERREDVNTVIYSTVMKGFASSRRLDKVFDVYDDMCARGIPRNLITYNTLLDACAKLSVMKRASQLLDNMRESDIEPDLITFSTLVKGYCAEGDVDRAFRILEDVKCRSKFAPDEIMYNSILDGCAKQHRVDDALRILEEMASTGVRPSNYTLSILVKLLGHARRLNQAFRMVEDLSSQNGFRPNIQVYTCLVQACVQNRRLEKALALHETLLAEGVCKLDEKFYAVLARACLQLRQPLKAAQVVRAAYQLSGNGVASPARRGTLPVGVESRTLEEVVAKLKGGSAEEQQAFAKLANELQEKRGLALTGMSASAGCRNDPHQGGSGSRGPKGPGNRK